MKILMVTGGCPYNDLLIREVQARNIDIENFGAWGMYLPDHLDEILAHKADIISLQWPEAISGNNEHDTEKILHDFTQALPALKKHGAKLLWTHHNILPHVRERLDLWQPLFQLFATHADASCHHSQWGMDYARRTYTYSSEQHFILRHGYVADEDVCTLSQIEARQKLGIDPEAACFFAMGALRPDKKILELIEVFKARKETLLIAGRGWNQYVDDVKAAAAQADNVHLFAEWVEAEDASLRARAADAFIFMYGEHHLTSGSPHLSQAHKLPQITLDSPYNREILGDAAVYIPVESDHQQALHQALDHLDRDALEEKRQILLNTRAEWHWPRIAELTEQAYKEILA